MDRLYKMEFAKSIPETASLYTERTSFTVSRKVMLASMISSQKNLFLENDRHSSTNWSVMNQNSQNPFITRTYSMPLLTYWVPVWCSSASNSVPTKVW